jgi:hypothetical protein
MNREIKFRLRKGNKIVGYEMWIVEQGKSGRWVYAYSDGVFNRNIPPIEHNEKDQYTSIKIAKNREIYEGDILSDEEGIIEPDVIEWNNKWSGFRLSRLRQNTFLLNTGYDTIIGTIYENPELLPKEDVGQP